VPGVLKNFIPGFDQIDKIVPLHPAIEMRYVPAKAALDTRFLL
jgi:hypothetical protein